MHLIVPEVAVRGDRVITLAQLETPIRVIKVGVFSNIENVFTESSAAASLKDFY